MELKVEDIAAVAESATATENPFNGIERL